jgi:hypothetical protein
MHSPFLRPRAVAMAIALAAAGAAQAAMPVFVDPATGALVIANGAPGNWKFKVVVGPQRGAVRVFDELSGREHAFAGIARIEARTGAGDESAEFDIHASQDLAVHVDTGSGNGQLKFQWRVPAGAAATASTLTMASGAGAVNADVDFQSETPASRFVWTTAFGAGHKTIAGKVSFAEGTDTAFQDINFSRLGGGTHKVQLFTESKARLGTLRWHAGSAREAAWQVVNDGRERLGVTATTRAQNASVEVTSAAPLTNVTLNGGVATVPDAALKIDVVQTVPGRINGRLNLAPAAAATKIESAFTGSGGTLSLAGAVRTGLAADHVRITSNLPVTSSLAVDAGDGDNLVELLFDERLSAPATGLPSLRTGAGRDTLLLRARSGSTATPAIDCGAGTDTATATVGTAVNCERFSR